MSLPLPVKQVTISRSTAHLIVSERGKERALARCELLVSSRAAAWAEHQAEYKIMGAASQPC